MWRFRQFNFSFALFRSSICYLNARDDHIFICVGLSPTVQYTLRHWEMFSWGANPRIRQYIWDIGIAGYLFRVIDNFVDGPNGKTPLAIGSNLGFNQRMSPIVFHGIRLFELEDIFCSHSSYTVLSIPKGRGWYLRYIGFREILSILSTEWRMCRM